MYNKLEKLDDVSSQNLVFSKLLALVIGAIALMYQMPLSQNFVNAHKVLVFITVTKYGADSLGRKAYFFHSA